MAQHTRLNDQITATRVRLIDAEGGQLGIVEVAEAKSQAIAAGLDLVEIAPRAEPPVCKIVDWGKYQYQQTKLAQKAKKQQKSQGLKQVRMGLKIGQHDLDVKLRRTREFLDDGNKVKLTVFFRGREIIHPELGHQLLERIMGELGEEAAVDQEPALAGKYLSMTIRKK